MANPKPTSTSFKKGKSGNPGGRPKESMEVKEYAKSYTMEAIKKLVYWMQEGDAKSSISAANAILDRAVGKPTQTAEIGGINGNDIVIKATVNFVSADRTKYQST